jgi:predicted Zn-dependent peptidase
VTEEEAMREEHPARRVKATRTFLWLVVSFLLVSAGWAQEARSHLPVEEFTLPNGMKFLLLQRPELATVSAGWVAKVGSANERPGLTGIAHFFEHMMFKGTRTIGTRDPVRDAKILEEQEALQEEIRRHYARQRERYRLGEVDDPFDPANRPPELVELESRFAKLVEEQRALMVKDEFDRIYTMAGATGLNATTNQDSTIYFVTVPANKLELWFWMESERLRDPVFREFYAERDVVQEERRLSVESTPTGRYDEQLNALFWISHPYKWDTVGWMSDLKMLSLAEAQSFFETYYAPNNLSAALVGHFDPQRVRELAERYFGRLPAGRRPVPEVVTLEEKQLAEKRMHAVCECPSQLQVWYHTVPFRHRDRYALDVVAGLLNGPTGRLRQRIVLEKKVGVSAAASQNARRWAGSFSVYAEAQEGTPLESLEAAVLEELERLKTEAVPERELQKVKNQLVAASLRNLEDPFFLNLQLLFYEGMGSWRHLEEWPERTLKVTAEDIERVAARYFTRENRTIARYERRQGSGHPD